MKITVGLGAIDDYEEFAAAGADEFFIGYVPEKWMKRYGKAPLNRREVLYYNVQIGSYSELLILRDMIQELRIPVTVAFNTVHLSEEQIDLVKEIADDCMKLGITDFIVADEKLIHELSEVDKIKLHLSGEFGELNHLILSGMPLKRVIFPRQTTIEEMAEMIKFEPEFEYEAFVLNEKCHFTGAYCNSLHCDEFCHACKIPYKLSGSLYEPEIIPDVAGATGCGLCSLWKFKEIGITHLKIVSRGNDTESTIADIRLLKNALKILDDSCSEKEYIEKMKIALFPAGCSRNCYQKIEEW